MTKWIALVLKSKLANGQVQPDIAYVEAETKEEAIRRITKYQWPESWWLASSVTQVLKIFDMHDPPDWLVIETEPVKVLQKPTGRRVRFVK